MQHSYHDVVSYATEAVPRLFSETEAVAKACAKRLEAGKYLHSKEIRALRETLRQETQDVEALRKLVNSNSREFLKNGKDRGITIRSLNDDIWARTGECRTRVSEILSATSQGCEFFGSIIEYLEDYESEFGYSRKPGIDPKIVGTLLIMGFERVEREFAWLSSQTSQALSPLERQFFEVLSHVEKDSEAGAETETAPEGGGELAKTALRRAVVSEEFRTITEHLRSAYEAEFAIVSKRLALHGSKVSKLPPRK